MGATPLGVIHPRDCGEPGGGIHAIAIMRHESIYLGATALDA